MRLGFGFVMLTYCTLSFSGPVHTLAYGDEVSSFSGVVLLYALLHLLPIIFVAALVEKRGWVILMITLMCLVAVFIGSPRYAFFDFLVVFFGGLFILSRVNNSPTNSVKSAIQSAKKTKAIPPQYTPAPEPEIDIDKSLAELTSKIMQEWIDEGIFVAEEELDSGRCWLWLHDVLLYESRNTGVFEKCTPFAQYDNFDRSSVWSGCSYFLSKQKQNYEQLIKVVENCRIMLIHQLLPSTKDALAIAAYQRDVATKGFWHA